MFLRQQEKRKRKAALAVYRHQAVQVSPVQTDVVETLPVVQQPTPLKPDIRVVVAKAVAKTAFSILMSHYGARHYRPNGPGRDA